MSGQSICDAVRLCLAELPDAEVLVGFVVVEFKDTTEFELVLVIVAGLMIA